MHVGGEDAGGDARAACANDVDETREHRLSEMRRHGRVETRASPAGGVGGEGEVGDQEQVGAGVEHAQVHLVCVIAEDADVDEFVRDPEKVGVGIGGLESGEHDERRAVAGGVGLVIDGEGCGAGALEYADHGG